jgi:hypothetical protein
VLWNRNDLLRFQLWTIFGSGPGSGSRQYLAQFSIKEKITQKLALSISVADPGCLSRIPDPTFSHPGSELSPSRIRIKEFKYFNPKKTKKMVSKL